jgi:hypothetical protein
MERRGRPTLLDIMGVVIITPLAIYQFIKWPWQVSVGTLVGLACAAGICWLWDRYRRGRGARR